MGSLTEGSWLSVAKSLTFRHPKADPSILGFLAMVLRMGPFILGVNLMVIPRLGSCSVPRSTPRMFPVWTSSLSSVLTLRSCSTSASGLSSMPTPELHFVLGSTLAMGPWSSSHFIVKSVQIILQTYSSFHDFTANIPQGLLIHWQRGQTHFVLRGIFGISRGCLPL